MAQIKRIKVGVASCGLAAGAGEVLEALKRNAGEIPVVGVGCIGHCYAEPLVEVETAADFAAVRISTGRRNAAARRFFAPYVLPDDDTF